MFRKLSIASAAVILVVSPLTFAAPAYADDLGGFYDTFTPVDTTPTDTGGYYDTFTPSYDTGGYYDTYTPSYDYSSGYLVSSYSGSYLSGGYLHGGSFPVGGNTSSSIYSPTNTWDNGNTNITDSGNTTSCTTPNSCSTYDNGNTTIYAPTTNTSNNCTNGSCNTTYNNTYSPPSISVVPGPTYAYAAPTAPVYHQPAPIYPASTPYVSLTQVPYTGLDLGFWGTIAYWGFLILWCLAAAYLIVVKRVQNRIYNSIKNFLFGTTDVEVAPALATGGMLSQNDLQALAQMLRSSFDFGASQEEESAPVPVQNAGEDKTDEFILAQIHRQTR